MNEDDVLTSGWYGWFNDPEATRKVDQHRFPNSRQKQLEFYRSQISGSSSKLQLGIVPTGTKKLVGVVSLSGIDWVSRKAEFAIMIGEAKWRGRGLGTEATRLILEHGFQRLNLHRIYLGVHAGHKAAIASYKRAGFKPEGVARDALYLDGKYHDVIQMGVLAREFGSKKTRK